MTIECLPNIPWCASAVFADAQERCVDGKPALAIWLDAENKTHWSQQGNKMELVFLCQTIIHDIMTNGG